MTPPEWRPRWGQLCLYKEDDDDDGRLCVVTTLFSNDFDCVDVMFKDDGFSSETVEVECLEPAPAAEILRALVDAASKALLMIRHSSDCDGAYCDDCLCGADETKSELRAMLQAVLNGGKGQ
jgi:hypothetical protein